MNETGNCGLIYSIRLTGSLQSTRLALRVVLITVALTFLNPSTYARNRAGTLSEGTQKLGESYGFFRESFPDATCEALRPYYHE
jgi:hypothetical protein